MICGISWSLYFTVNFFLFGHIHVYVWFLKCFFFLQEMIDVAVLMAVCLVHTVSVENFTCVEHIWHFRLKFTDPHLNWTPVFHLQWKTNV